jgi:hypothetical protein
MADFVDCTTNNFDFWTLLQSCFAKDVTSGHVYFRVCPCTEDTRDLDPIECLNADDFVQLFNRSLVLGADGRPALRVAVDFYHDGEGLEDAQFCAMENGIDLQSRLVFTYCNDGGVALRMADICSQIG